MPDRFGVEPTAVNARRKDASDRGTRNDHIQQARLCRSAASRHRAARHDPRAGAGRCTHAGSGGARQPIRQSSWRDHRHRFPHPAHRQGRPRAGHRVHRAVDPRQRICHRARHPARADVERRRNAEPAVLQRRQLHSRCAAGRSARPRPKPHPGARQRPPHRRFPAALPGPQQFHRYLEPPGRPDRPD